MPTYEFRCDDCDVLFEEYLSISNRDKPLKCPCPKCQSMGVKRAFESFPTVGYDTNLKPTSDFKELIDTVKNNGQVPKRYHDRLDASKNMTGGRIGHKSTSATDTEDTKKKDQVYEQRD
jgi:putative FmdB family regulatory protein